MEKDLTDVGFMYVAEQCSPSSDDNTVKNINVVNKSGVFFVEFDTGLHSFECMNRNDRMYLRSNLEENFKTERIQSLLHDNAFFGEQDHPMEITEHGKLAKKRVQNIYMPNRSHKIMLPKFEGNMLNAHIQTASGTEAGRGFANEIIQGLIPDFSCRAIATLRLINGKPVVIVRKLITYDWVLYPSHKEATIIGSPTGAIKEIATTVTESAKDRIKKFTKDVALPLKEILESVGMKDPNTELIMESFDLDKSALVGFDDDKTHAIIKDNNNVIYSNMSPKTIHEVEDFYHSFNI